MNKEHYVIRGGREGYERLALLARVFWSGTKALFERVGIGSGMTCLDLGCGGGTVTFQLARLVGTGGQVIGVDMDEIKLALARAAASEQGFSNLEFKAMNVYDWHEPDVYDIVYCRMLLQHLSQPVGLLKKMWAAVKPGGALIVEDSDFDGAFCYPPNDGYDLCIRNYCKLLESYGGDAEIGHKLYGYFLEAGIPNPNLSINQPVNATGEMKRLKLLTLEATADSMLGQGLASRGEIDAAIASLAAFTDDPQTLIAESRLFQLWSRK